MASAFQTVSWVNSTNVYEVNVRQYTPEGTIRAFASHLPRLKDMGVETLWFMPLQPIGKVNRKGTLGSYYSISDYLSLNPEYGTTEDFRSFMQQAHGMGFKVIIDWVANHTSWDHVWTQTYPDFYSKNEHGHFRPPYPDWADVIHLNYDNPQLWNEMIKAMKFWVNEFDIDGFRCDMAHLVRLDFWLEARRELDNLKKLFWLAETEDSHYHEVFDVTYTWEFLHTMEAYWRREKGIDELMMVLEKYKRDFPPDAIRMFFTSNHDENSHSGSEYERLGHAALAFAVLCSTWDSIPLIYSGQELPVKNRIRFFEKDPINWNSKPELHYFYKSLLTLHSLHPALRACDSNSRISKLSTSADDKVLAYLRTNGEKEVLVMLNLSDKKDLQFSVTDDRLNGIYSDIFSGEQMDFTRQKEFLMKNWEYRVCEK